MFNALSSISPYAALSSLSNFARSVGDDSPTYVSGAATAACAVAIIPVLAAGYFVIATILTSCGLILLYATYNLKDKITLRNENANLTRNNNDLLTNIENLQKTRNDLSQKIDELKPLQATLKQFTEKNNITLDQFQTLLNQGAESNNEVEKFLRTRSQELGKIEGRISTLTQQQQDIQDKTQEALAEQKKIQGVTKQILTIINNFLSSGSQEDANAIQSALKDLVDEHPPVIEST